MSCTLDCLAGGDVCVSQQFYRELKDPSKIAELNGTDFDFRRYDCFRAQPVRTGHLLAATANFSFFDFYRKIFTSLVNEST